MAKIPPDTPGARLRKLRLTLKKTQQQFADELGITGSVLSRYEKNMRGPHVYFFRLLRMKTGVDLNWLLSGEGEMFPFRIDNLGVKLSKAEKIRDSAEKIIGLIEELK